LPSTKLFLPGRNFGRDQFAFSDPNIPANWQATGTKWTDYSQVVANFEKDPD
jgi:hypothetical protein